ncbi:Hypp1196 [Branchiostoma lanceolatum]|uniref:Hypp1196 protein n=1 Tax=Branchiostoma lanceolatum TaxID=7740 RepID=A0A8J9ZHU6_BRALA|nr:Hypp1196 [Branchiostoma lanceolatum]
MCCCLVVMVSNAEAERVFSCQNRIKTKTRTLLSIDQLDRLIRLSYARIPMADFDFAAAREEYLLAPRRL